MAEKNVRDGIEYEEFIEGSGLFFPVGRTTEELSKKFAEAVERICKSRLSHGKPIPQIFKPENEIQYQAKEA